MRVSHHPSKVTRNATIAPVVVAQVEVVADERVLLKKHAEGEGRGE